jgi:hypothetical protein
MIASSGRRSRRITDSSIRTSSRWCPSKHPRIMSRNISRPPRRLMWFRKMWLGLSSQWKQTSWSRGHCKVGVIVISNRTWACAPWWVWRRNTSVRGRRSFPVRSYTTHPYRWRLWRRSTARRRALTSTSCRPLHVRHPMWYNMSIRKNGVTKLVEVIWYPL